MQRNVAGQSWLAFAFNRSTGVPVTGDASNITAQLAKDGGTIAALSTTNPTEVGFGYYRFALTQAETDAAILDLVVQSSTSNVSALAVQATKETTPIGFTDLTVGNITSGVTVSLQNVRLSLQQQLTLDGTTDLIVIQGDDYTRSGVRIDLVTDSLDDPDMDLSTYHLIIAANTGASAQKVVLRADILGLPGSHYAIFNPPSTMTELWPIGTFPLLYRIEWDANEYQTIDAEGLLTVNPFDTVPAHIVNLPTPS